jgi:FkbH-like protein
MSAGESQQGVLFKEVSSLIKLGKAGDAMRRLREAIRRGRLDAEGLQKAGRTIAKVRAATNEFPAGVRVLLLGQCTTSWVKDAVVAESWGRGTALDVIDGEYDNVMQELMARRARATGPGVVILLPWTQRLLAPDDERPAAARLEDELRFWKQAWGIVNDSLRARVLQVGYDWVGTGALGCHLAGSEEGELGLVRRMNEALRRELPEGSYFLDLEQVAGSEGRCRFYDPRRYFWTKQPFSDSGVALLARHLCAGIRAMVTGPKKVLVVDLDNTLWGGVVGEVGPLGVALGETPDGEAYRAFQRYLGDLRRKRGVLLAICSKNNPEDALGPFQENHDMALRLTDFAHVEVSWLPKATGLEKIAASLNLGLDSFVFFDDNPAEREHILQALPEVEVIEVPADPSEYVRSLEAGLWFEASSVSEADTQRAQQYEREGERKEWRQRSDSLDDYLRSLEMRGSVAGIQEANLQRVVQLIGKTNQFNLTTRRHSTSEVRRMLSETGAVGLALTLADRFGDHGLIAVLLGVPEPRRAARALRIDTWLMSCRVIGRTAEEFLFNHFLEHAGRLGYEWVVGEYLPTQKNSQVADLYPRLGFTRVETRPDDGTPYQLRLADAAPAPTFVQSGE